MQVNLNQINQEDFHVKSGVIAGDKCFLIYPKKFPKWDNLNKWFRSSIWRASDLSPISLGFRKFTSLDGEQPEFEPIDLSGNLEFIQKLDGSLAIFSTYKGQLIARTRGIWDLRTLANGCELVEFLEKYPKFFNSDLLKSEKVSILCEWTSPTNIICLKETNEPELWLIGIINHEDYSYSSQEQLDILANFWGLRRPKRFQFNTIEEMTAAVLNFEDKEGVVIYGNAGQILKKCKSLSYLRLHKFRSNATLENTLDLFFEFECSLLEDFQAKLAEKFDWECVKMVQDHAARIFEAKLSVDILGSNILCYVSQLKGMTRKEAAACIIRDAGEFKSFYFTILDGKMLDKKQLKNLYLKFLEK